MKLKHTLLLPTVALLTIVGCSNSSNKLSVNEVRLNATKFPQVIILGDILNNIIVNDTKGRRRKNNRLIEAYIDINNTTSTKISFQYRFKWYDPQGYEVGKDMSIWRTHYIEGLSSEKISEVAPVGEALKYKCLLKKTY